MTKLSVNINKIALLRNSRGRDFPSVLEFAGLCLDYGAHGITLHPRPDQRHARYSDVTAMKKICEERNVELNVEGYPSADFLEVVLEAKPAQCTLVPDSPDQITSDHGWNVIENRSFLEDTIGQLKERGIRTSLFIDHDCTEISAIRDIKSDRVELYTEPYAEAFNSDTGPEVLSSFRSSAISAQQLGLGVNAGHDLSLANLEAFLSIPQVLEVSIGHALVVESIDSGLERTIKSYLKIIEDRLNKAPQTTSASARV